MFLRNDANLPGHWLRIVPIDPHLRSEKCQKMPIYVSKIPIDAGAGRAPARRLGRRRKDMLDNDGPAIAAP